MKSFVAGLLAVGAFSASFAATIETNLRDRLAEPVKQVIAPVAQSVVEPIVYDVFGKQGRLLKQGEATRLIVVSRPDNECPPCGRQHVVSNDLKRDGYDVTTIMLSSYNGKESVSVTPTLLFYDGNKLILKHKGTMSYSAITRILKKQAVND